MNFKNIFMRLPGDGEAKKIILLWYSTGELQALQLIVLAVFGAMD